MYNITLKKLIKEGYYAFNLGCYRVVGDIPNANPGIQ